MCVCVWVCVQSLSCVWLSVTPCTVACQAPLSVGFPRQEYWNGLPFQWIFRGSSQPRIEPVSPALAGGFFTTAPPGKPHVVVYRCQSQSPSPFHPHPCLGIYTFVVCICVSYFYFGQQDWLKPFFWGRKEIGLERYVAPACCGLCLQNKANPLCFQLVGIQNEASECFSREKQHDEHGIWRPRHDTLY